MRDYRPVSLACASVENRDVQLSPTIDCQSATRKTAQEVRRPIGDRLSAPISAWRCVRARTISTYSTLCFLSSRVNCWLARRYCLVGCRLKEHGVRRQNIFHIIVLGIINYLTLISVLYNSAHCAYMWVCMYVRACVRACVCVCVCVCD